MSCPAFEVLEEYAGGELAEADRAHVRAHVAGCAACEEEVALLWAERRLFEDRAASPDLPSPPAFDAVLARARLAPVRRIEPGPSRLAQLVVGLSAAAALLGLLSAERIHEPPTEAQPDPAADLVCRGGPADGSEESAASLDRAIAGLEAEHHACLMATPGHRDEETCNAACTEEP